MQHQPLALLLFLFSLLSGYAESHGQTGQRSHEIQWITFGEALRMQQSAPKKIFIDMYTDWCGWCKKMDATTFRNDTIALYMNQRFYAVKFDAERKDTVVIGGNIYINPNPKGTRSTHQLAAALLQNRLSYPSYVFLDEKGQLVSVVPGYMPAKEFGMVLHFFGENAYLNTKWEDFAAGYQGEKMEN